MATGDTQASGGTLTTGDIPTTGGSLATGSTLAVRELARHSRVHLLEPLAYSAFVALMRSAYVILSDSGGVQEEAPALGTPVLVLRDETERPEAVEARCAYLVGCHRQPIVDAVTLLFRDRDEYVRMARPTTLFGDRHASEPIVAALGRFFVPSRSIAVPPALQEGKPSWCPPRACPGSLTHPAPTDLPVRAGQRRFSRRVDCRGH